ncbi:hypothetical protein AVEN_22015-1 [Araneus ventricosus]|uniref:Uncharacterized protein n=1 Tax=Araneus ventricosus TaxID=182803 RepID=A0A4Y2HRZ5_ARAVE|nr:hypothetical protein AVEN_22015-1 [Araneus ventricosus]
MKRTTPEPILTLQTSAAHFTTSAERRLTHGSRFSGQQAYIRGGSSVKSGFGNLRLRSRDLTTRPLQLQSKSGSENFALKFISQETIFIAIILTMAKTCE